MDYIFIILNFFYNIYILYNIILFLKESGSSYETTINFMLTSFNNIKINNYFLPQNFGNFNKKKRKKYVLENYDKYIYEILDRQYDLINEINVLRMKNNIPKLKFSLKENIPTFMIKKPVDIILYPTKNIFELSNKTYLFRYPANEFKYRINDKIILDILLKDNLNHIEVFMKEDTEYILITETIYDTELEDDLLNTEEDQNFLNRNYLMRKSVSYKE